MKPAILLSILWQLFAVGFLTAQTLEQHDVQRVSADIWQQTALADAAVNDLLISENGAVVAATVGQGILRTDDRGDSWQSLNNGLFNLAVFDVAQTSSGLLFAATDGGGVFRSADGGANWDAVNTGLTVPAVIALLIDEASGQIFAGTVGGIFRSSDDGDVWIAASTGLPPGVIVYALYANNGFLFAATGGHGLYQSMDQGELWESNGLQGLEVRAINSNTNQELLAGTWFDGAYLRASSGQWTAAGLENIHVMDFTVANSGDVFAATHGRGVYRSAANGQQWEAFNDSTISGGVWTLAIDQQNYLYAGSSGSGVYRSHSPVPTALPVTNRDELPSDFVLDQNFPNPFNPTTSIRYRIANRAFVKLQVYNLLGGEVRVLVRQMQPPGLYTVTFDAVDLPTGTYFYRLSANDRQKTRRMLLIR